MAPKKVIVPVPDAPMVFVQVPDAPKGLVKMDPGIRTREPLFAQNSHRYAPNDDVAMYFKLTGEDVRDGLTREFKKIDDAAPTANNAPPGNLTWYISVKFIAALALNKIDWTQMSYKYPPVVGPSDDQIDEEDFLRNWKKQWEHPTEKDFPKEIPGIPARHSTGTLYLVSIPSAFCQQKQQAGKFGDIWYKFIDKLWLSTGETRYTKPPRYDNVELEHGLKFVIEEVARVRFQKQQGDKEGFELMERYAQHMKDEKRAKANVEVICEPPGTGWREMSRSPFGLYTTYIHEDDWHKYMLGLEAATGGETAIRQFVGKPPEKLKEMQLRLLRNRGEFFDHVETLMQRFEPGGDHDCLGDPANWDVSVNRFINQYTVIVKVQQGAGPGERSLLNNRLSYHKINKVYGQRDRVDKQPKVMANQAPNVLARDLGWKYRKPVKPLKRRTDFNENQLANSFYIAEWTHLCAYSFGGFLYAEAEDIGESGQIPENLVLATSETNSLMTRYETGWQNLFKKEVSLLKKYSDGSDVKEAAIKKLYPSGILDIRVNSADTPVRYDYHDGTKYTWTEIDFRSQSQSPTQPVKQGQNDPPTIQQLQNMADMYNSIAYTINYDIKLEEFSYILRAKPDKQEFVFYPHMRPFFHRAEALMDDFLLEEMVKRAKIHMDDTLGQGVGFGASTGQTASSIYDGFSNLNAASGTQLTMGPLDSQPLVSQKDRIEVETGSNTSLDGDVSMNQKSKQPSPDQQRMSVLELDHSLSHPSASDDSDRKRVELGGMQLESVSEPITQHGQEQDLGGLLRMSTQTSPLNNYFAFYNGAPPTLPSFPDHTQYQQAYQAGQAGNGARDASAQSSDAHRRRRLSDAADEDFPHGNEFITKRLKGEQEYFEQKK